MSTVAPSAKSLIADRPTALATRGLSKAFGSLPVARDIAINLPVGARYALIGPNGALEYCRAAKRDGIVRSLGVTSHQRPLAAAMARAVVSP